MFVVTRFRVPADDAQFRRQAQEVLELLMSKPGNIGGTLGRNVDDAELWVLSTTWRNTGSYRRALGSPDVKANAWPLLYRALDEPSAYEVATGTNPLNEPEARSIG